MFPEFVDKSRIEKESFASSETTAASGLVMPKITSNASLPRTLGIGLTRGCNFSCAMCPVTAHASQESQPFEFMSLDLVRAMVQEIDHWPSIARVWLFGWGEPLTHPNFRECLVEFYRSSVMRNAMVIQHTNASLLTGDRAEALLEVPLVKKLVFSFDGFGDKESYERLRGPHFDQVLANIRTFAAQAAKCRPDLKLATCSILPREGEVPGLIIPSREDAIQRLESLFQPLGVQVETRNLHAYNGGDNLSLAGRIDAPVKGGCNFVEENSLYFTVHGEAQPCCAVYDTGHNVGQFPGASFGELLNNEKMRDLRHKLRLDQREELPFCRKCVFSLGVLDEANVRNFWKEIDGRGELVDLEERQHLFGTVVPTPHRVLRLDLGCGRTKQPGFVGTDRFPLPGVDIVMDMDGAFPLADDTFDMVYACHSLEHVKNLMFTMKEVYRVCKHGAQVCILAPYYQQGGNIANPYHLQVFNEHTPRFWTSSHLAPIEPAEYFSPHAPHWGLSESDNSSPGIDLRCLRMEFFYFPEYRGLPVEKQRTARKRYMDVCDQILYHLVVVKKPMDEEELKCIAAGMEYYDPPFLAARRAVDRCPDSVASDGQRSEARGLCQVKKNGSPDLDGDDWEECETQSNVAVNSGNRGDCVPRAIATRVAEELDAFRHRRIVRCLRRLRNRGDCQKALPTSFRQLIDDSRLFCSGLKGYLLQDSVNLQRAVLVYPLALNGRKLSGLLLGIVGELPPSCGMLGVTIVSASGEAVANSLVSAASLNPDEPVRFEFPAVKLRAGEQYRLHVFAQGVDVPMRILEWRKYPWRGLRRTKTQAFCAFLFEHGR